MEKMKGIVEFKLFIDANWEISISIKVYDQYGLPLFEQLPFISLAKIMRSDWDDDLRNYGFISQKIIEYIHDHVRELEVNKVYKYELW